MDAITRARISGQSGLVTRAQALAAGFSRKAIEWRLSRGQWTVLQPGVYLTTPGRNEWEMRAVAALLYAGAGAALSGRSAGHVWGLVKQEPGTIEVAVPARRLVRPQPGLQVVRARHTVERTHPTEWPHRIVAAHTVWDLSVGKEFDRAVALAAKAVQLEITTAEQLRVALQERTRQRHRTLLLEALSDVDAGAESPAEVRYVRDVERARSADGHGPEAERGRPTSRRRVRGGGRHRGGRRASRA